MKKTVAKLAVFMAVLLTACITFGAVHGYSTADNDDAVMAAGTEAESSAEGSSIDVAAVSSSAAVSPVEYTAVGTAEKVVSVVLTAEEAAEFGIATDCAIEAEVTLTYTAQNTATTQYIPEWAELSEEEQAYYTQAGYYPSLAEATAAAVKSATAMTDADVADWISSEPTKDELTTSYTAIACIAK